MNHKWRYFGAGLVITTLIMIPLLDIIGFNALIVAAIFAIIAITIMVVRPEKRKISFSFLMGVVASIPAVFFIAFIMLLAGGGVC